MSVWPDPPGSYGRPDPGRLGLFNLGCFSATVGSLFLLFRADLARWRQIRRTAWGILPAEPGGRSRDIGLWDWNPRTNEIVFSAQWRRQTGYAETEIDNQLPAWLCLVHPEDESRVRAAFQAAAARPAAGFDAVFRLRHRDGTWRTMRARGVEARHATGGSGHLVGVQFDVTERNQVDGEMGKIHARLLESQKLESLGMLAGSIAHDFNNLLSGVLSNAELIELDLPPGWPAQCPRRPDQTGCNPHGRPIPGDARLFWPGFLQHHVR